MAKQQEKMATYQLFVARCFTPHPPPLSSHTKNYFDFEFYSLCSKSGLSELRTLFSFLFEMVTVSEL